MGKSLSSEYKHMLNIQETAEVRSLIRAKKYDEALEILKSCIKRNKNTPETLGLYQELRMQALLGMKRYASVEKNSIEYAKLFPRKKQEFELHELKAKIGLGKYEQARRLLEKLLLQYPGKEFILEKLEIQILTETRNYFEALDIISEMVEKYPNFGYEFLKPRIDILIKMEQYDEAQKEIDKNIERYPAQESNFLLKKVEVLRLVGKYDEALELIAELEGKVPELSKFYEIERRRIFRDRKVNKELGITGNVEKLPRINETTLKELMDMDEESFTYLAKGLNMEEVVFLLIARYKKLGQNTLALASIEEYKKRAGEDVDEEFITRTLPLINSKKRFIDVVEWTKVANRLQLNFKRAEDYIKNFYKKPDEEERSLI